MKKNKTMRIASVLLIAVLLTTSIISGTFAKYVTADSAEDHARVAKFGVLVTADGSLFANSYKNATDGNTPGDKDADKKADYMELTVETSGALGDDAISQLVAPGTQNDDGLTISITGAPEVDVRINIDFDKDSLKDVFLASGVDLPDMTNSKKNSTFDLDDDYYPIVFTVSGEFVENQWKAIKATAAFDDLTAKEKETYISGSLETIVAVLEEVFGGEDEKGIYVDANQELEDVFGTLKITWAWAYEGAQNLNGAKFNAKTVDKADTLLGDLAARDFGDFTYKAFKKDGETETDKSETFNALSADNEDYNLIVALNLTITVTQVD